MFQEMCRGRYFLHATIIIRQAPGDAARSGFFCAPFPFATASKENVRSGCTGYFVFTLSGLEIGSRDQAGTAGYNLNGGDFPLWHMNWHRFPTTTPFSSRISTPRP